MPTTWQKQDPTKPLGAGKYRLRGTVRTAYNAATTRAFEVAFRAEYALKGCQVSAFKHAPPLLSAHDAMPGPWPFIVEFTVPPGPAASTAGIDPRALFAIAALVISIAVAARLSSAEIDKMIETSAQAATQVIGAAKDALAETIFNPGTLILAALIVALFVGAVARKG